MNAVLIKFMLEMQCENYCAEKAETRKEIYFSNGVKGNFFSKMCREHVSVNKK